MPLIDFMPAFAIVGKYSDDDPYDYNNADYWTYQFLQKSRDAEGVEQPDVIISARLCTDVINDMQGISSG